MNHPRMSLQTILEAESRVALTTPKWLYLVMHASNLSILVVPRSKVSKWAFDWQSLVFSIKLQSLTCLDRFADVEKLEVQWSQMYGVGPACDLRWWAISESFEANFRGHPSTLQTMLKISVVDGEERCDDFPRAGASFRRLSTLIRLWEVGIETKVIESDTKISECLIL